MTNSAVNTRGRSLERSAGASRRCEGETRQPTRGQMLQAARQLRAVGLTVARLGREAWRETLLDSVRRDSATQASSHVAPHPLLTPDGLRRQRERWIAAASEAELAEAERLYAPAVDGCQTCGGVRFVRVAVTRDDPRFGQAVPCEDCATDTAEERLERARIPRGMARRMTFDAFQPLYNCDALASMQVWKPRDSIVLHGPPGIGKTHLAVATLVRAIEQGSRGRFAYVPELLDEVRRRYSPDHPEDAQDYLDRIAAAPLLLLDDVGAERGTEWAVERLGMLIDHRYRARMPTIVTTNYRDLAGVEHAMGAWIASRLGSFTWITLGGPDMRVAGRQTAQLC